MAASLTSDIQTPSYQGERITIHRSTIEPPLREIEIQQRRISIKLKKSAIQKKLGDPPRPPPLALHRDGLLRALVGDESAVYYGGVAIDFDIFVNRGPVQDSCGDRKLP
jgi:hypothetical protein